MKLSAISIALIPMLSLSAAQAAVYDIVEIGDVPEVRFTAAAALNDAGEVVFNGGISSANLASSSEPSFSGFFNGDGRSYYDFPLDLDAIDFTSEAAVAALTEEQIADAMNGITDAVSLSILMSQNFARQPKGLALPYFKATNADAQNIILRDFTAAPARGNSEYLYDINNQSVAVGIASTPFTKQSFTPAPTEETPEPKAQVVWSPEGAMVLGTVVKNGVVTTIPAPYQEMGGGYSLAQAISNTGYIAGVASIGMTEEFKTKVLEKCDGTTQPIAVCQHNEIAASPAFMDVLNPLVFNNAITSTFNYYQRAGMLWQLSGDTLSEPEILGYLGDKNTGLPYVGENAIDNINYVSRPNDVNDNGIAVGWSVYSDSSREVNFNIGVGQAIKTIERSYQASLFADGQVLPLVDPVEWSRSGAVAINNNNIVVGGAIKIINSNQRTKMFIHDYNLGTTDFVEGFFLSSTTIPRAINDNNIIVGKAEAILANTTTRRDRAFIMDLADNSFKDLNTYLDCNSPYTLVDAVSINNQGEILATALVEKEQRDIKGNLVLDAAGNPIKANLTTTVILNPIANGEPENCGAIEDTYSRKSGSFSFAWLLGLALLGWRRIAR
ncbi:DUF3466 family protein [Rheinheimera salexigens]|uniref:DUF3466 family protein n=1 Tax=Rheinheimera salexigens TaxID=1628148 RepID=A0A1E7Q671_9GAMM|nr:DUF3466 family protein [Rheinheimera salexigens]OEY69692.1 hypothetical protein BI198_09065 [Rheinheimera salexigens]